MFEKLRNSWELVKASAKVLSADKELIVFPILSSLGVLVVSITFALPMILTGFLDFVLFSEDGPQIFGFLIGFLFYVVQYFVIFYANSALVGAAMIRLKGGDPTVRDGIRIANSHLGAILGYSVLAATVGMIIKTISERSKNLGRFIVSLIGMAWNLATFLVVPVLVVEGLGPIESVKRSALLLKRTWGEQIAGNFGIGAIFGLLTFLGILIFAPVLMIGIANDLLALIIGAVIGLVIYLILLSMVQGALNGIYVAAVYNYAADGNIGTFFEPDQITKAFVSG